MGKRVSFGFELVKPWSVKAAFGIFAAIQIWDAVSNQFGLPKIPKLWGMTPSFDPWWAWLLGILVFALFEYVRRSIPSSSALAPLQSELPPPPVPHNPDISKVREGLTAVRAEVESMGISLLKLPDALRSIEALKDDLRSVTEQLSAEATTRGNLEAALQGSLTALAEVQSRDRQKNDRLLLLLSGVLRVPAKTRAIRALHPQLVAQLENGPAAHSPGIWEQYQVSWNGFIGLMFDQPELAEKLSELRQTVIPLTPADAAYSKATNIQEWRISEVRGLYPYLDELEDELIVGFANRISQLVA